MQYLNKTRYSKKNQFGPRVRFNHGYHDAHFDIENDCIRELSATIHNTKHVSPVFDVMYFEGYKAGLSETKYTGNSSNAWLIFRSTLNETQLAEVYQAEIDAEMFGCKKEYRQYRLVDAIRNAKSVCGMGE